MVHAALLSLNVNLSTSEPRCRQVVRVAVLSLKNLLADEKLQLGPDMVEAGLPKVVQQRTNQVGKGLFRDQLSSMSGVQLSRAEMVNSLHSVSLPCGLIQGSTSTDAWWVTVLATADTLQRRSQRCTPPLTLSVRRNACLPGIAGQLLIRLKVPGL